MMHLPAMLAYSTNRRSRIPVLLIYILGVVGLAIASPAAQEQWPLGPGHTFNDQKPLPPNEFTNKTTTLPTLLNALDVLQTSYFEIWQGNWPTGIDWTKAVIGTYLSSALLTISTSFDSLSSAKDSENLINKYFSQLIGAYFGQDAFALRQEAYDDMLWVVLGWLESVKFINTHSASHYSSTGHDGDWYGKDLIPAFAHRARIFWELASQGWDTSLCNGGMIWNPYLVPYKNAITNELYIAASISMYLYFPGDENTSPFGFASPPVLTSVDAAPPGRPHDPKYLAAAIEAYRWLNNSNMTDAKGLYVDGYHISGWSSEQPKNGSQNTRCDSRNEMVYTYNQGVLLSGQRGLYEATGARSYLEDGHKLVADVIAATGWDLTHNIVPPQSNALAKWQGLGRSGILEEACDAPAICSQDGQTFKGIFFHHLTSFCSPLPEHLVLPDGIFVGKDLADDRKLHENQCKRYGEWIRHNAQAAIGTKDVEGKFGMWWGAPNRRDGSDFDLEVELPDTAVDYRNSGVPQKWKDSKKWKSREIDEEVKEKGRKVAARDLNDRGRGRTVETQGGGVAVLRALWELVDTR